LKSNQGQKEEVILHEGTSKVLNSLMYKECDNCLNLNSNL